MKQTKVKTRPKPPVEFRPHKDHAWLDEIVARDVTMVHVEQMTIDSFWMGIYFSDNKRVSCTFQVGDVVADDEDGVPTRELRLRAAVEEV